MTDDELDAMQRDLGYRTESLRLARERATTPGERAILDEVEAQLAADVRRYAAAVREEQGMATTTRTTIGKVLDDADRAGLGKLTYDGGVLTRREYEGDFPFLGREVDVVDTGDRREVYLAPMGPDQKKPDLVLVPFSSARKPDATD